MIVASHQPNLLPNTRFFYKMAKSDLFDIRHQVQFIERGYIHRVKMRDVWFTLPLNPKPKGHVPIDTVRVDLPKAKDLFRRTMHGRYSGSTFYKTRGLELVERFDALGSDYLWQMNLDLILHLRDMLGITTPLCLGIDNEGKKGEGLVSVLSAYPNCDAYLSGTGAMKYMEDTTAFDEAGIKVIWSRHDPSTDDSIISVLMDHENPMDHVLREKE